MNVGLWIYFLLWPAGMFFTSIKNYRADWAKNGIWLFIIFFGFTFIPLEGNDSMAYIEYLYEVHRSNIDFSTFFENMVVSSFFVKVRQGFLPLNVFYVVIRCDINTPRETDKENGH